METILRLTLSILWAGESLWRLPNQCAGFRWVGRLLDSSCRQKSMLVALVFWSANCAAQGFVMASAFAQPSAAMIAPGSKNINNILGIPFASGSFSHGASPTRPSLLVSMIEEGPSGDSRLDQHILAVPSIDENDGSIRVIPRPSSTPSAKAAIRARDPVSLLRPSPVAPPTRTVENALSIHAEPTPNTLDENESEYGLPFWRKEGSLAGSLRDSTRESVALRIDGAADESPTRLQPLMIVRLGSYTLPISLYVPILGRISPR